jgi:hypothetical protein
MSGIHKIMVGEREILCIDYSDLKEDQMIALINEALEIVLKDNRPVFTFSTFNERNFATPKVMRHFENVNRQVKHLIKKQALLGLRPTQKIILKGLNLILNRELRSFDTKEECIAYLVSED